MLNISGTKITLTRGDSAYITINIMNEDGTPYELKPGDVVRCQVRDKANDGDLLFEGQVETVDNELVFHIYPEDTKNAEVKSYVWDAQLETADGDIFTFITESAFKITNEVTK